MYKIAITKHFKKQLKKLSKKDECLKTELFFALQNFSKSKAIPIGCGVFKSRIKRLAKGKSGGYRVYVFIKEVRGILAPICIFAKSQKEDITAKELNYHLDLVKEELSKKAPPLP